MEDKRIYLSAPLEKKLMPLAGISKATITKKLRDMWSIDFEIDKYINEIENPCYSKILPLTEIWVDDEGWFILQNNPSENDDGNRIYKTFTAFGCEMQLQQENVTDLYINCGTDLSREYYEENLDPLGIQIRNGSFYIKNSSDDKESDDYWELGFLNILEREHMTKKGWKVGHVDSSVSVKRGRKFEIETSNTYSIITQDIPKAFNCLPIFDRINKTVSFYDIKNIGKIINLELSFRNFINSAEITNQKDEFFTRFRVAGNNDNTSIIYYNFGSEYIEDLTYLIESGVIPDDLALKYKNYIDYRDSRRDEYLDSYNAIHENQKKISYLKDLRPIDECQSNWNAYSIDELNIEKDKFIAIRDYIAKMYTDSDGNVDVPESSPDYTTYRSIIDVIIPDIDNEIERQENGGTTEFEHIDYKTNWDLYGLSDLEIALKNYQNGIASLQRMGYDHPWSSNDSTEQGAHNRQYETYQKYVKYVSDIQIRITKLKEEIESYQTILEQEQNKRNEIATSVNINNPSFGFSQVDIAFLNYLYVDTDYKDSTIEVIDNTNYQEIGQCSKELFLSAKEQASIESRPQHRYSISLDNPYLEEKVANVIKDFSVGDFLFLETDNDSKSKQRVIEVSYNIFDIDSLEYSITLSDVINVCGEADDWRFLLDSSNSSSKNSISKTSSNSQYISKIAYSAASEVLEKYLGSGGGTGQGFGSGGGGFNISGLSNTELLELADKLSGLVKGSLDLNELNTKFATIEQLKAEQIRTNSLEANLGSFQTIVTGEIKAQNAKFETVDGQIANFKLLLSGEAGVGILNAIHITGKNVVFDDAVINSAAIANISADKISSGWINTNQVTIKSEDGGIQIVGSTQQWTDADGNVRMQAGQDANGNFNFAVFGADGSTRYFDQDGIHESAVPNGLIVDKMVSDTANVSAHKLDIDSLFDVINADGSHTINSSKVWIDSENQSIGAKFDSITEGIGKIQTDIGFQNGKIETLIKETDEDIDKINTLLNSTVQTVNENKSTISKLESTSETIQKEMTTVSQKVDEFNVTVSKAESNAVTQAKAYTDAQFKINSDKISLIVSDESTSGQIVIQPDALTAIAKDINLTGKVTFTDLDSIMQGKVNDGTSASDTVKEWTYPGTTTINGGKIETGSIKASSLEISDVINSINSSETKIDAAAITIDGTGLSSKFESYTTKEDFEKMNIGATNLLKSSRLNHTSTVNPIATYFFGEVKPEYEQEYTVQIHGSLPNSSEWIIYDESENEVIRITHDEIKNSSYTKTFTWPSNNRENSYIEVHTSPQSEATIEWIMFEPGNMPTAWSPCVDEYATVSNMSLLQQNVEEISATLATTTQQVQEVLDETGERITVLNETISSTQSYQSALAARLEVSERNVTQISDDIQTIRDVTMFFHADINGLRIGKNTNTGEDPFAMLLSNEALSITENGTEVARFAGLSMIIRQAEIKDYLVVGNLEKGQKRVKIYLDESNMLVCKRMN